MLFTQKPTCAGWDKKALLTEGVEGFIIIF